MGKTSSTTGHRHSKIILALSTTVVVVLGALLLRGLGDAPGEGGDAPGEREAHSANGPGSLHPELPSSELPDVTPVPEVSPWDSKPGDAELPPGFTPAWKLAPPRPEPIEVAQPVRPPDPREHRPPIHNPNGVNGQRPPRPAAR